MKLEWFGHACFRAVGENGSVVFDPYADGAVPGLRLMRIYADAVLCSHAHSDHNAADKVVTSERKADFSLRRIPCFHDEVGGAKRGENLISVVTLDGLNIAHMGDIGHMPDDETLRAIGSIDVLMIPVGGVYTVDAKGAYDLCAGIAPKVIVPMHYRDGKRGLQNVAPVDDFLRFFDKKDIRRVGRVWDTAECDISSGVVLFTEPTQL